MKLSKKFLLLPGLLLLSYLITGLLLLLLAFFLYKYNLSSTVINLSITLIYIISCFFGGFFMGKRVDCKKYLWGFLFAFVYILILVLASLLLSHKICLTDTGSIAMIFLCLGSGTLGGMFA